MPWDCWFKPYKSPTPMWVTKSPANCQRPPDAEIQWKDMEKFRTKLFSHSHPKQMKIILLEATAQTGAKLGIPSAVASAVSIHLDKFYQNQIRVG